MSLVRLALRLATVKALTGRTYADDRVRDSSIVPLELAIANDPKPIIVVYTDSDDVTIRGLDLLTPEGGSKTLIILIAVAASLATDGDVVFEFAPTDASTEFQVDMIERAVVAALLDPRIASVWSDLWRRLAVRVVGWRSERGANSERGVRFAARQIVITIDPMSEPVPGDPSVVTGDGLWKDFLAAMAADADPAFAAMAPIVAKAITGDPLTERERAQMSLGLTTAGRQAITEVVPAIDAQDEGEEPASIEEILIDAVRE